MRRSMLFLPGNTPNILINGDALGADAVILDLEDAVAPTEKDAARVLTRHIMSEMGFPACEVIVRINALDTPYWQEDLRALLPYKPSLIMPPKVDTAEDVKKLDAFLTEFEAAQGLPPVKLIPLIETALGVENVYTIATASPRVTALFLGGEDLAASLRCKRTKDGEEISYARKRIVVAGRAAGVEIYDTPFTDTNDDAGLVEDANYARGLGFTGKAAISPRHIPMINAVFTPTREEIEYARRVLEAIREAESRGRGAVSLDGKMIDAPIVTRARTTMEAAEELGLEVDFYE